MNLNPFRRKQPEPVKAASPENPTMSLNNPDLWANFGIGANRFGENVTEQSALSNSTVFRCTAILSGLVGTLPLKTYEDTPDQGRIEASDHRLADLFLVAPNPKQGPTAFVWKETLATQLLLYGNSFSILRYDQAARIVAIDPVPPWIVEIRMQSGRKTYVVKWPYASTETVDEASMLHFVGPLSMDGVTGLGRIRQAARDSIAIARSIQNTTGSAFENAIRPSSLIKVPKDVSLTALNRIKAFFTGDTGGAFNSGKPLFIDNDMDVTPFVVSMSELTAVDAARYTVSEISRFFGVPLSLLNESNGVTSFGAGISELVRGLLRFTLDPDLSRIEAELNRKIFGQSKFYCMFDREALLQSDPLALAQQQQIQITSGTLKINEARQKLHRSQVEGGDTIFINSASIPLERAISQPAPNAATPAEDNSPSEGEGNSNETS